MTLEATAVIVDNSGMGQTDVNTPLSDEQKRQPIFGCRFCSSDDISNHKKHIVIIQLLIFIVGIIILDI